MKFEIDFLYDDEAPKKNFELGKGVARSKTHLGHNIPILTT
jgi:hypothetical protein